MEKRRVILYIAMSLDGYIATEEGSLDWLSLVEMPGQDYGYETFVRQVDTVIMGRKTFESIVAIIGKPLPNRTNIVITRDKEWKYEDVLSVDSIEDAIQLAKRKPGGEEVFIIGGGQVYELGVSYSDKLYLTLIDDTKEADSFFPDYAAVFTKKVFEEYRDWNGLKYAWVDLVR